MLHTITDIKIDLRLPVFFYLFKERPIPKELGQISSLGDTQGLTGGLTT